MAVLQVCLIPFPLAETPDLEGGFQTFPPPKLRAYLLKSLLDVAETVSPLPWVELSPWTEF